MAWYASSYICSETTDTINSGNHFSNLIHCVTEIPAVCWFFIRISYVVVALTVVKEFKGKFVSWWKLETASDIVNRRVKVLSFKRMSIVIVLTIHRMKVVHETIFYEGLQELFVWLRIHRWSLLPVEFRCIHEDTIFFLTVWRSFVYVFEWINILLLPLLFIKILFVLCMVRMVIFTRRNVSIIDPFGSSPWRYKLIRLITSCVHLRLVYERGHVCIIQL